MAGVATETEPYGQQRMTRRNKLEEEFVGIQETLHNTAIRSARFGTDEKAALKLQSLEAVEAYCQRLFDDTLSTKDDFDQKHSSGAGRVKKDLNETAASVYEVIKAISPITDVIKDSGMPFAGSAIGIITFVFAAAKNRQASEERINKMLWAMKDRFLGLRLLGRIYKSNSALDQQIQRNIIIAYIRFANFLNAVVEYYDLGGFLRSMKALGRSTSLEDQAASAQDAIASVRQDSDDLIHQSINEIQRSSNEIQRSSDEINKKLDSTQAELDLTQTKLDSVKVELDSVKTELVSVKTELDSVKTELDSVKTELDSVKTELDSVKTELVSVNVELDSVKVELDSMKTELNLVKVELVSAHSTIKQLKQQNEELLESNAHGELEKVRAELGLDAISLEAELLRLDTREGNILAQFPRNQYTGKTIGDRLSEVERGLPYTTWRDSPKPSVLVLAGLNQVMQGSHCWLSPIAIRLVRKLEKAQPPELFAYQLIGERDTCDTLEYILTSIVYRLLVRHRDVLRNQTEYDRFRFALQGYKRAKAAEGATLYGIHRELGKVVLGALNMFEPGRTVWIILDRLDKCERVAMAARDRDRKRERRDLLKALVRLAEDQSLKVNLRVLVVVNSRDWNMDGNTSDDFGHAEGSNTLVLERIPQWKPY